MWGAEKTGTTPPLLVLLVIVLLNIVILHERPQNLLLCYGVLLTETLRVVVKVY